MRTEAELKAYTSLQTIFHTQVNRGHITVKVFSMPLDEFGSAEDVRSVLKPIKAVSL